MQHETTGKEEGGKQAFSRKNMVPGATKGVPGASRSKKYGRIWTGKAYISDERKKEN